MSHNEIQTTKQLANYLRCSEDFIVKAIEEEFYVIDNLLSIRLNKISVVKRNINKKGNKPGYRTVHQVFSHQLDNCLKILNNNLTAIYLPHSCVHGFVKKKSIKTNADAHLLKKTILSLDLDNYFESITREMIVKAFLNIGFQSNTASWLAELTTINGVLVQGFCTSPTIANIITTPLDISLSEYCDNNDITYTRYADDLYFSTNEESIDQKSLIKIIENFGFNINYKKTKLMKRGYHQYVTGLTVFDDKYSRISKKKKKNLRLEIHFISKFGYERHIGRKLAKEGLKITDPLYKSTLHTEIIKKRLHLFGWLYFIRGIEPKFFEKYYPLLLGSK